MQCICGVIFNPRQGTGGKPQQYCSQRCANRQRQKSNRDRKAGIYHPNRDIARYDITGITNTILCGDALEHLKRLSDKCVQMICTSPPYYGLRDYGIAGQIGLEDTPQEYVTKLVNLFREARRILRDNGVLWLNLGDSYAGSGKGGQPSMYSQHWEPAYGNKGLVYPGLSAKQLVGIPWRVALALQEDGWILRSDVIWHKSNCMPESVKDRPTRSHEYVFLLSKNRHYYYDQRAVQEPNVHRGRQENGETRHEKNRRSVWSIPTQASALAHCATMSPPLAELCVLAGSRPGDLVCDPFMGVGTTAFVAQKHGRKYFGIEINPEYIRLANQRLATVQRRTQGAEAT